MIDRPGNNRYMLQEHLKISISFAGLFFASTNAFGCMQAQAKNKFTKIVKCYFCIIEFLRV